MSDHADPDEHRLYAQPRSGPTRNGYFAHNRFVNIIFRLVDSGARLLTLRRKISPAPDIPRRILIANGAHLGDIVLSLTIIPLIRRAFPKAEIGMLVGNWSSMVVRGHPDIKWIHAVDHWRMNRAKTSRFAKFLNYVRTQRRTLFELRQVQYDVAIDLYPYFPNSALLLYRAAIPRRIGYTSAGLGPLFTDPVEWIARDQSIVQYHVALLNCLTGRCDTTDNSDQPLLRFAPNPSAKSVSLPHPYVVLHVGTGGVTKEWPLEYWRKLVNQLYRSFNCRLVFTGAGETERTAIQAVIHDLNECENLCDRLDWRGFVDVVADADLVIGLDSVAGHIAAAVGTAAILITNGVQQPALWRPRSADCMVMSQRVGCSPCYLSRGCDAMACIRGLSPDAVFAQAAQVLSSRMIPQPVPKESVTGLSLNS